MTAFIAHPLPTVSKGGVKRHSYVPQMTWRRPRRTSYEQSLQALKGRSLLTLRGMSDLGTAALLHEMCTRMYLGPLATSAAFGADTQLLLGGLMGVWTAAAFAERLRLHTAHIIKESAALGKRWDSAFIHRPQLEQDEAGMAVAWMYLLDEMEGSGGGGLMQKLSRGSSAGKLGMVNVLGDLDVKSNVVTGVLCGMKEDGDREVREGVNRILEGYREGVEKKGVMEVVEEQVEKMGKVALRGRRGGNMFEGLKWAEVHGICAVALLIAGYELVSVLDGGDLPGRLVGVGWMLAMGGLVAYPNSSGVWKRFRRTLEKTPGIR